MLRRLMRSGANGQPVSLRRGAKRLLERLNHALDTRLADMFDVDLGNLDRTEDPREMCEHYTVASDEDVARIAAANAIRWKTLLDRLAGEGWATELATGGALERRQFDAERKTDAARIVRNDAYYNHVVDTLLDAPTNVDPHEQ